MDDVTRRVFVRWTGLGLAGLALGCDGGEVGDDDVPCCDTDDTDGDTDAADTDVADTDTADCTPTGDDIEGPFYVEGVPVRSNLDLYGDPGDRLRLHGFVRDTACNPLAGAVIEIWHCDDEGAYDNASDDMRYRGQLAVGSDGAYEFTTLMPARYLNGANYRPAHIHVKIWKDGVELLTTQLYFDGDPYNESDAWYDPSRSMPVVEEGEGKVATRFDFAV